MPGLMMVIAMTIITKLPVNGMVVIAVPKLIQIHTRTFTVQPVLHVKSHHQIVWMPGLVMDIVMMQTTKLPVNGMVEIAVTKLMLILTRTFTVQPVLHVKSHHQIVWMPGLVMDFVMISTTKLIVSLILVIVATIKTLTMTYTVTIVLNVRS